MDVEPTASTRPIRRFGPLAFVLVVHIIALALSLSGTKVDEYAWRLVPTFVLFPIYLTLIAIWLALQAAFWQRLAWAIALVAITIGWYAYWSDSISGEIVLMATFHTLAACGLFAVARRSVDVPRVPRRNRFSTRELLTWVTVLAIVIASIRPVAGKFIDGWGYAINASASFVLLYLLIVAQYISVASLLVIGTLHRRLWPRYGVLAAVVFLALNAAEPWLIALITKWEMFFDIEPWYYNSLQLGLLLATLLAWRHSGLMSASTSTTSRDHSE